VALLWVLCTCSMGAVARAVAAVAAMLWIFQWLLFADLAGSSHVACVAFVAVG
jgi:hypothetical protein